MLEKLEKEKEELLASMEQSLANKFERLYKEEKKKRQEAEGETTIVKGIGMNSPEMKSLQKELKEVKDDNKKLAIQINDLEKKVRRI